MTDGTHADPLQLAELMAARLCHDLSGPVGPMAGMVELALEEPADAEEALTVIGQTADGLIARIRLLRAAWGGDCGAMDIETIAGLVTAGLARKKVTIDVSGLVGTAPGETCLAPDTARLLLNVLILGVESLPTGGTLTCAGQPAGDILISIAGPRAAWPAGLAACLIDPSAARELMTTPQSVQLPFTALLASRPGPRLAMLFGAASPDAAPPLLISPPWD